VTVMAVAAAMALVPLALAVVAARACACNVRRFRHALRTAPLDGLDLSGATVVPVPEPRRWPRLDTVTDPAVAAAYAALAEERMFTAMAAGDLATVFGGAVLGVSVPRLFSGGVEAWVAVGGVAITTFGVVIRHTAHRWEPVAARYRARYHALTQVPPRPPRRLSRRFLGAFGLLPRRLAGESGETRTSRYGRKGPPP
jgi:hypothetical protein